MSQPRVTVLIDTFNYGHFIEGAIDSVLSQTLPPEEMEILVVDDGSTDDTESRVRKYGARVQYLSKSNGGQGSAVSFGVAHARGEIIVLLDADDYWLPEKVSRVVQEFDTNPGVGMVHHRQKELDARTGELRTGAFHPLSGNLAATEESILSFQPTSMSSIAFRKQVLESIVPIPEGITIQADGYMQAIAVFLAPIVAIDEPLGVYRFHGTNLYFLSEAEEDKARDEERRERRAQTVRAILDSLEKWFRAHGYDPKRPTVRAMLARWKTILDREEFAIRPPGRFRFFRHLMESNRNQLSLMTPQLRLINYFNAFSSLVVGYKHFHLLDGWREGVTRRLSGRRSENGPSQST